MALWNQTTPDDNSEKARIELTPAAAVAPVNANPPAAAKEPSSKERRESVFGTGVSIEGQLEQRLQLRWRGRFRPRPPKAPQHYPRVQPAPHLPQCHRPGRRSFLLFFLFGVLFFFPPPPVQRVGSVVPDL